jgi:hypothetical protein
VIARLDVGVDDTDGLATIGQATVPAARSRKR